MAHSHNLFRVIKGGKRDSMIEEETILVDVKSGCQGGLLRFLQFQMPPQEILVLATHVQDCFYCREYLRSLSDLLARRQIITRQLKEGGF